MATLKNRHLKLYREFNLKAGPIYIGYKMKLVPAATMKQKMIQKFSNVLQKLSPTEQEAFFKAVYENIAADFNQDVLNKLKDYQDKTYETVVLSGAYTPLLEIVAAELGIHYCIGTNIPEDKKPADHIHGKRKLSKITESFPNINWAESVALSDSIDDLPLLEQVGTPIVVLPDAKLAAHASKHKWYFIS